MSFGKFLRVGFTGVEVVALVALLMGLVAGTNLVKKQQLTGSKASACSPIGPHCVNGKAWWCYGDHDDQGTRCCNDNNTANWFDCPSTPQPQCDTANTLYCRDGKSWWCNGNRQWEAGEGKSCANKCSPLGSEPSCSDNLNYKDIGSACGNNGHCAANGSSNGFTTCRCDVPAATSTPVPAVSQNPLQTCGPINTLKCINGTSSWCNASGRLEVGNKACSTSICHPTLSAGSCANSSNYKAEGSSCGTNSTCQKTSTSEGFAVCGCQDNTPPPATSCSQAGGILCDKSSNTCAGGQNANFNSATQLCCTGPAQCKPKTICEKNTLVGCTADGKNQKYCNNTGTDYRSQTCNGFSCNPANGLCQVCTPGNKQCTANGASQTCNADGMGWSTPQTCSFGCDTVTKSCRTCAPNSKQCSNSNDLPHSNLQICRSDGSQFDTTTCSLGCNTTNSPHCNTLCRPGGLSCYNGNISVCAGDSYQTAIACETGCNPGSTECRSCVSGKTRCSADGKSVETCNNNGMGWSARSCSTSCIPNNDAPGSFTCGEDSYSGCVNDSSDIYCRNRNVNDACTLLTSQGGTCQHQSGTGLGCNCVANNAGQNSIGQSTQTSTSLQAVNAPTTTIQEANPFDSNIQPNVVPPALDGTQEIPAVVVSVSPAPVAQTPVTFTQVVRSLFQAAFRLFNFH